MRGQNQDGVIMYNTIQYNIFIPISQYCKFDNPTAVIIPIIIQYHVISNNKINLFLKIINCIVVGLLTSVEIQINSHANFLGMLWG
jgi:hypothetical protein